MEKRYVISIDQGTTGTRVMLIDKGGNIVSGAYEEHNQIYPKPGWVEHDPTEIWEKVRINIKKVVADRNVDTAAISGIGITNQRETTVVWERHSGLPIYNAIVWQCTRTKDICQELLAAGVEPLIREKTGLVVSTYFSGPKIRWILDNLPNARKMGEAGQLLFGTIDTWIIWNLTGGAAGGVHVTDFSNASRTMLMNLETLDWDEELLSILKIPREMMPEIRPSSERRSYGFTRRNGPFGSDVPVCGDIGDQQAALFGQGCFNPGDAKNTYGTGCFLLMNTGKRIIIPKSGLLATVAYGIGKEDVRYAIEGSIAITGAAIQWLRDNLGIIKDAAETEEIASKVEDAGGVYFVPAFSGLFAPYWDMNARGIIIGLTRYITRAHIVRATLEAICYQTRDVFDSMTEEIKRCEDHSIQGITTLKVDGGAVRNNLLLQLQADILGVPCVRPKNMETTALGAAFCAGIASNLWNNMDELKDILKVDKTFYPAWDESRRSAAFNGWKKAVERTRNWVG